MPATCPNCQRKSLFVDYERGVYVCASCGFVPDLPVFSVEPVLDEEGKVLGVGPPTYFWESNKKKTQITRYIKLKTPEAAAAHRRLIHIETKTFLDSIEKVRGNLMKWINKICGGELKIDSTTTREAARLADKVARAKLTRGRPVEVTAASIVVLACNKTGNLTPLSKIAASAGVSVDDVRKGVLFLVNSLGESFAAPSAMKFISSCVSIILSEYGLATELYYNKVYTVSSEVCHELYKKGLFSGKNQRSVAVAIVLSVIKMLSGKKLPMMKEILDMAEVKSEITILRRIREVMPFVEATIKKLKVEKIE